MMETEENRFEKELREANRKASPADKELLRDFYGIMKQIENIPALPDPEPATPEEQTHQQVSLKLIRRCLGQNS